MKPVSEEPRCESSESGSSQFLTIQNGSKVVFDKTLFSTSEDLDLVNKFSIVFTMVKDRISFNSLPNMCRGAPLIDVQTVEEHSVVDGTSFSFFPDSIIFKMQK